MKKVAEIDMHRLAFYLSNEIHKSTAVGAIEVPLSAITTLQLLMRHMPSQRFITYGRGTFAISVDIRWWILL
jgi:hypothetical protein